MVIRWRSTVICWSLVTAMFLFSTGQAYASDYGSTLMANTGYGDSDPNGVWLLNDGQFTELYFWNPVPNYASKFVNSTLAARDNGDCVEVGREYNKRINGIPLRNPIGFVVSYKNGTYNEGFMDGLNHPGYIVVRDIGFVNGRWYGFLLARFRPGGSLSDRYDVSVWDPNTNIWTPVYSFLGTGIVSSRSILACERDDTEVPAVPPPPNPPAGTWYGTFYRSQYRSYYAADTYYYWPGAKHAPRPWQNNDKYQNPPYGFFLNHLFDAQWLYCNNYEIH